MPSVDYQRLSDREISDVVAFAQSLPPVDRVMGPIQPGPVGTLLIGLGRVPLSAYDIDHTQEHLEVPPPAEPNARFGEHLARVCVGCHGKEYRGGPQPGAPPDAVPPGNLTPHPDGLAGWTSEDFVKAMRDAVRPDGTVLDPTMPTAMLGKMTDVELGALFAYLSTLDPLPTGP